MRQLILTGDLVIDMSETFSSTFQRTKGAPIKSEGRTVLPIFKLQIGGGRQNYLIRRLGSESASVAGLRIKAVKGMVEVNNQKYSDIILWADTSPEVVPLSVHSKSGCELRIWNVWRTNDVVQAWVGDAGVSASENGDLIVLECSGGDKGVNFSALVVEIRKDEVNTESG